jgi:hypothetical protein
MKNEDVIQLVNAGVLGITTHSVSPAHAYKVYKFKKALRSAYKLIHESEMAAISEVGIEDPLAFDARLAELKATDAPTPEQQKELADKLATMERLNAMRNSIWTDDVTLQDVKTIPYQEWHKLQEENRNAKIHGQAVDILSGDVEYLLEGVLWEPFEE